MTDLFIRFDIENDQILEGPMLLPGKLVALDMATLNSLGWYLALPLEYDIGNTFDENVHQRTSQDFIYTDTPYPAIRRYITTAPRAIEEVRNYIICKLTEFRNNLFNTGFTYGGYVFDADDDARLNWTAAVTSVTALAFMNGLSHSQIDAALPNHSWTKRDNTEAILTSTEILHCGVLLGKWASDCIKYCRTKKNQALEEENFELLWEIWTTNDISLWPSSDLGGTLTLSQEV